VALARRAEAPERAEGSGEGKGRERGVLVCPD
jgi:hypothetical protein